VRGALAACAALVLLVAPAFAQPPPDLGPVVGPVNEALGQVVPPLLNATYAATGQNITREDVRLAVELNFTKGDVDFFGLLLGSGRAEVQAKIHGRLEMRVISSERIRAAVEGENAYNMSAENATFLSEVFLPAEVFRATLTAEAIAAFQKDQEAALGDYLHRTIPELDILGLEFAWSNVHPQQALTDVSLTEPPIVLELDLVVQYIRVESVRSLLSAYFESRDPDPAKESRKEYIARMKAENGTPLQERDFFAAAAYTQLLNLSMQPGWSLEIDLRVPRGYSFTYFNEEVENHGDRHATFAVNAQSADDEVQKVFLASLTHRKMVAFALFMALWAVGLVAAFPFRFLYGRYRLPRMKP
jgi:hypothetical protein